MLLFQARNQIASKNEQIKKLLEEVARLKAGNLDRQTKDLYAHNELVRDEVGLAGVENFTQDDAGAWSYEKPAEPEAEE